MHNLFSLCEKYCFKMQHKSSSKLLEKIISIMYVLKIDATTFITYGQFKTIKSKNTNYIVLHLYV